MKKLVSVILAVAMLLSLTTLAVAEEKITIAGIVFKDEFTMKMVQQGYQDAANDLGVELLVGSS